MNWKGIIEDQNTYDAVKIKIDEIYKVIVKYYNKENIGLLGGCGGDLLFLYYYYKFTQKDEHLLMLQKKYRMVFRDFIISPYSSYCNGHSGICWLIRFLTNEGIIESADADNQLFEIDRHIIQIMLLYAKYNNFDFLHGGIGVAYYFATQNNKNGNVALSDFMNMLNDNKVDNLDGSVKWLTEVNIKPNEKTLAYNLGMSHGMISIAAFLVKLLDSRNNEIIARDLLSKIMLFYKHNTNLSSFRSVFSPWIIPESDEFTESRLAWCYGDLGICPVLYKASILLDDSELKELSLNTLVKSTKRQNNLLDKITDACMCHGTAGICHIYNRMYQRTNLKVFKDLALYWLEETLKMGQVNEQLAGFRFIHTGGEFSNYSLLTGVSGVGLSLLATISSEEPKWDECLMLS